MITVLSDTHASGEYDLDGALARAVRQADTVVHAGDFTTEAALDAIQEEADRLLAVHGNADDATVTERLPPARVFEENGVRFAVTHTQRGGEMGLVYFARERDADVVISGHTHRPRVTREEGVLLINPGSHEEPRGGHRTYAELSVENGAVEGAIRTVDGTAVQSIAPEGQSASGTGQ
ncbi:metallophosphoesterase [Halanaeroarchaeum sulfurireducens]|uniref:Phosphoesterase n=1 Tax=Halanaeroarchaeum sulfurireducens TaxID=1604004 RepID=A0A0F7PBP0_9EURY|nr:metallophosphoesterase [Halanaeroarchaeum sulfurireducens]AKH98591.1 phosphoesterase [Halanaeroarchaeum sulfurireducens]ALG83033.1 phosphoesterase [Halanaeroarchaeum sulfurireducens]